MVPSVFCSLNSIGKHTLLNCISRHAEWRDSRTFVRVTMVCQTRNSLDMRSRSLTWTTQCWSLCICVIHHRGPFPIRCAFVLFCSITDLPNSRMTSRIPPGASFSLCRTGLFSVSSLPDPALPSQHPRFLIAYQWYSSHKFLGRGSRWWLMVRNMFCTCQWMTLSPMNLNVCPSDICVTQAVPTPLVWHQREERPCAVGKFARRIRVLLTW
jgi:hypothetical protein